MNKGIFLMLLLVSIKTFGQNLAFENDKFVWCGLDFSHVKLVGKEGFNDVGEIKDYYFKTWNYLLVDEYKKYDITEAYDKKEQITNFSIVSRQNQVPKVKNLVINTDYDIDEIELAKTVFHYKDIDDEIPLGLIYIVETLNKSDNQAKISVVFFDITTGEIVWSRECTGKPNGLGFRNYWAGAFYDVIKESAYYFKKDSMIHKKQQRQKNKRKK